MKRRWQIRFLAAAISVAMTVTALPVSAANVLLEDVSAMDASETEVFTDNRLFSGFTQEPEISENRTQKSAEDVVADTEEAFLYEEYTDDGEACISIYGLAVQGVTRAVIPDTIEGKPVRKIRKMQSSTLQEVIVPEGVTSIGFECFSHCSALTSVTFKENSRLASIETYAFWFTGLREIVIPAGVISIGDGCFGNCSELTSVVFAENSHLEEIGDGAFANTGITEIAIPEEVKSIGGSCFYGCRKLTSVVFAENIRLDRIESGVFHSTGLKEIVIPKEVTSIGSLCFSNCSALTTVIFEEGSCLESIGATCFYSAGLREIVIPKGVTSIGESCFYECRGLESVVFEEGSCLESIGACVFKFTGLGEIVIPKGVTSIGEDCFYECRGLEYVVFEEGSCLESIGACAFGFTGLGEIVIPKGVTSIGEDCFNECRGLEYVVFEEGSCLEVIGARAFYRCGLLSIVIPSSVKRIEGHGFYGCSELTQVSIDRNSMLEFIGGYAFGETGLTRLEILSYREIVLEAFFIPYSAVLYCLPDTPIIEALKKIQLWDSESGEYVPKCEYVNEMVLSLQDEKGQKVTTGFQASWYIHGSEQLIGTGTRVFLSDLTKSYDCQISLGEELGNLYYEPETFTVGAGALTAEVALEKIGTIPVTGRITDKYGTPLPDTDLEITCTANGKYDTVLSAATNENGEFRVEIRNTVADAVVSCEGYQSRTIRLLSDRTEEERIDCGTVIMYGLPKARITLAMKLKSAVGEGKEPEETEIVSVDGYTFSAYNMTKNIPVTVSWESPWILLDESSVSPGDRVQIQAVYQDNTRTAESVEIVLDENCCGGGALIVIEQGFAQAEKFSGAFPVRAFVFDSNGVRVSNQLVTEQWKSGGLEEGQYTAVFMEDKSDIQDVSRHQALAELGLTEGEDYISRKLKITNGEIFMLDVIAVPERKEMSREYLDEEKSSVSINRSTVTVGDYVSLKMRYSIAEALRKTLKNRKIVIQLPPNLQYVDGSMVFLEEDNGRRVNVAYSEDTRRIEVPFSQLSGKEADEGYLRCMLISVESGEYSLNPCMAFEIGDAENAAASAMMLPLGSSIEMESPKLSIQLPNKVGDPSVLVQGKAAAGSQIVIYDNGQEAKRATSNIRGTWEAVVDLGKPYVGGYHCIHAQIVDAHGYTFSTEKKNLVYHPDYIPAVRRVIMNHGNIQKEWTFGREKTANGSYSFNPSYPDLTFQVEFDTETPDSLGEKLPIVYVVTTDANGKDTYVKASYDSETETWVGVKNYTTENLPETLTVAYTQPEPETLLDYDQIADTSGDYLEMLEELEINMEDFYDVDFLDSEGSIKVRFDPKTEDGLPMMEMEITMPDAAVVAAENYDFTRMKDGEGNEFAIAAEYVDKNEFLYTVLFNEETALQLRITASETSAVGKSREVGSAGDAVESMSESFTGSILSILTAGLSDQVSLINDIVEMNNFTITAYDDFIWTISQINNDYILHRQKNGNYALYREEIQEFWQQSEALMDRYELFYKANLSLIKGYQGRMAVFNGAIALGAGATKAAKQVVVAGTKSGKAFMEGAKKMLTDPNFQKMFSSAAKGMGSVLGCNIDAGVLRWTANGKISSAEIWKSLAGPCLSVATGLDKNWLWAMLKERNEGFLAEAEILKENIKARYHTDEEDEELPLVTGTRQRSKSKYKACIDPSGYVYEAVASNRLEGVTASIYQLVTNMDEAGEVTGTEWIPWNAEDYDQISGQITSDNGEYGWDVPVGKWKVLYEKEGYGTVWSDEMDVPPEWTDVNIGMVSEAVPQLERINAYTDEVEIVFAQYMQPESVLSGLQISVGEAAVNGSWEAVDEEQNYEKTDSYAKTYRFIPKADFTLGSEVTVAVNGAISYNGKPLESSGTAVVQGKITDIAVKAASVIPCRKEQEVTIFLEGDGAGREILLTNLTPYMLTVAETKVTADEQGKAIFHITGKLPGSGAVKLEAESTGLTKEIAVSIRNLCTVHTPNTSTETILKAATCTQEGRASYICKNCGEVYEEALPVDLDAHTYTEKVIAPDCTNKGYTQHICVECGNTWKDNETAAKGHTPVVDLAYSATCTAQGMTQGIHCSVCQAVLEAQRPILALGHDYVTEITKATMKADGSIVTRCRRCTDVKSVETIAYPKTVILSKTSYSYNGKACKPAVTVKDRNGKIISSGYYTVTYATGRKNPGQYNVTITWNGNYSGSVTKSFRILPKGTSIRKKTASAKGFKLTWKKQAAQTTGYQIQYSTSKKFTGKITKTKLISKKKTTSCSISKLKANKTYYIRIRTYQSVKINGKATKLYSAWSKTSSVKTKK